MGKEKGPGHGGWVQITAVRCCSYCRTTFPGEQLRNKCDPRKSHSTRMPCVNISIERCRCARVCDGRVRFIFCRGAVTGERELRAFVWFTRLPVYCQRSAQIFRHKHHCADTTPKSRPGGASVLHNPSPPHRCWNVTPGRTLRNTLPLCQ